MQPIAAVLARRSHIVDIKLKQLDLVFVAYSHLRKEIDPHS